MKNIFSRFSWFFFFFLAFLHPVKAQYPSDSIQFYLLTASPGEETYAAFGHSAIRVADPVHGTDLAYNYGTFDFSTPHFYWKFITGKLMYSLSIQRFEHFRDAYQSWGQAIYQQKINLTNKEKWQLLNNLRINYHPRNRYYRYDFFRDNCATRIRDMIQKSVDGKVLYDSGYVTQNQNFRQLISTYLNNEPWTFFGINLLLGKGSDSIATLTDYMFLPEHMRDLYTRTKIARGGSVSFITEKPVELFPTMLSFPKPNPFTSPVTIFWLVFIIMAILTYWEYRKGICFRGLNFFLFFVVGLLGCLFLFLTTCSLHKVLTQNYNIVWANPLSLVIAVGFFFKSKPAWHRNLILFYSLLLVLFIPVSFFITQDIPGAAYPLMGILILRAMGYVFSGQKFY
jgi:hypothetical protein